MSRPIPDQVTQGIEGWDAEVNSNFDLIFDSPEPLKVFTTFAGLPAAGSFDNSLALVVEAGKKQQLFLSDGSNWIAVNPREVRKINSSVDAEAADKIRFTIQIRDLENEDLAEIRHLKIWMSDSDKGPAQNTGMVGNMAQVVSGVKVFNHAQELAQFLTNATGEVQIDVEVSDARTKFMVIDTGFGIFSQSATWT